MTPLAAADTAVARLACAAPLQQAIDAAGDRLIELAKRLQDEGFPRLGSSVFAARYELPSLTGAYATNDVLERIDRALEIKCAAWDEVERARRAVDALIETRRRDELALAFEDDDEIDLGLAAIGGV